MVKLVLNQIKLIATDFLKRFRHPTQRDVRRSLLALAALLSLYLVVLILLTPSIGDIRKAKSEQPAQVLSADGKELAVFKRANREWVKLDDISPQVVAALIATEDHRFFDHHGIDWRRTASAALSTASGDRQGGSTITQQLARNLYPEAIGRAPTLTRKLKEAITALKIEAIYSKKEILETYLNTVPFLYNAFGIEMAARTYFDSSADALDVLQSATLIGMLKGNSYYNPVLNPERALQRRNTVLAQMVKSHSLTPAKYESLKKKPLQIDFERQSEPPGSAPHLAQHLRKWLIAWADRNDYDIYGDGLVVRTTIDSRLQAMASQAVTRQGNQLQAIADAAWSQRSGWGNSKNLVQAFVRETPEYRSTLASGLTPPEAMKKLLANKDFMQTLRRQKTQVQAGFLALDPSNGQIKAWIGSRDYGQDAYDHVQQARRQPGSTFKPFVYGAAFLQGARPSDTLIDQAVEIALPGGEIWRPTDHEPPSGRAMSLRDGLVYSKNTITAQLMQTVGAAKVAKLARAMGVRQSPLDAVPSLALGTSPVSLKEMVSAYATIANGGGHIEPMLVTRIEDSAGQVLEEFAPAKRENVLPRSVAYTLLDVMRGVVDRGTGAGIRSRFGIRADVAGKTGTTQDNADGWFILMHPQLVAGAWVGFNDSRITLRSDYWGQGAHSALPIVGDFFQKSLRSRLIDPRIRFAEPSDEGLFARLWRQISGWFQRLLPAPKKAERPPAEHRATPPPNSAAEHQPEPQEAADSAALPVPTEVAPPAQQPPSEDNLPKPSEQPSTSLDSGSNASPSEDNGVPAAAGKP